MQTDLIIYVFVLEKKNWSVRRHNQRFFPTSQLAIPKLMSGLGTSVKSAQIKK
jgi:hypothetical protein